MSSVTKKTTTTTTVLKTQTVREEGKEANLQADNEYQQALARRVSRYSLKPVTFLRFLDELKNLCNLLSSITVKLILVLQIISARINNF